MVLEILLNAKTHLVVKDIYYKVAKTHPQVGLTSIYRTLELLVQFKIVNRFEFGEGQYRYEMGSEYKKHHHHIVCDQCGKIIDYSDFMNEEINFFSNLQAFLSEKYNFTILQHEVFFFGRCCKCIQEK
jgi:Fur family ferric uptake transcriptional regulator